MIRLILQLAIYLYPRQHICWTSPEALELFLLASVVVSFLGVCRPRWPEVSRLFFACWLGGFSTLAWLAHSPLVVALAAPTLILYLSRQLLTIFPVPFSSGGFFRVVVGLAALGQLFPGRLGHACNTAAVTCAMGSILEVAFFSQSDRLYGLGVICIIMVPQTLLRARRSGE